MAPVIILTDSSAYLPPELIARYPIRVIPLTLNWEGQTYRDGIDISAGDFYRRLAKSNSLPTTSQVSTGEFEKVIEELRASGSDVLILPISSGISSTYHSAASVVQHYSEEHVALIDTRLVSMALGFQVLAAARAAQAGASLNECKQVALDAYQNIGVFFTVDTLKYLAAGGRINSAKRLLGSALSIKPLLEIRDGKIELVSSVVSRKKAIERMMNLVEKQIAGRAPVRISVFHALAEETALEILDTARERFDPVESILAEISPVVGAHVGPGSISVAFQAGS